MVCILIMLCVPSVAAYNCGNDECESYGGFGETHNSCPADCFCGNEDCHFDETAASCPTDCYCGNGKCDSGERQTGCYSDCPPICGNDIVEIGEVCDDGSLNSDNLADACRTDCRDAYCTDGVIDAGEDCDMGYHAGAVPNICRDDCTVPYCGDGVVDDGTMGWNGVEFLEECDDGNADNNDGCTDECKGCTPIQDNLVIGASQGTPFCSVTIDDNGPEGVMIVEGYDITLDCQGATITSSSGTGVGMLIRGDAIVVENCNFIGYDIGVKIEGGGNMLKGCRICNNTVDIDANMFSNYGDENFCDNAPNWFERVQGCSFECDGRENRYFMNTIQQDCIVRGLPVHDKLSTEIVADKGILEMILDFLGLGDDESSPVPTSTLVSPKVTLTVPKKRSAPMTESTISTTLPLPITQQAYITLPSSITIPTTITLHRTSTLITVTTITRTTTTSTITLSPKTTVPVTTTASTTTYDLKTATTLKIPLKTQFPTVTTLISSLVYTCSSSKAPECGGSCPPNQICQTYSSLTHNALSCICANLTQRTITKRLSPIRM